MILTVCLNPAVDVTYTVPRLFPGESHRVMDVHARPGGKGVNVARVLHHLGADVIVTGLCGGPSGREIIAGLAPEGLPARFVKTRAESRRTVTVIDADSATAFNETGGAVTSAEWAAFLDGFRELVPAAAVVVLSGSVPAGCPVDAYALLTSAARAAGAAVVLDAEGEQLRAALCAEPDLAKPNAIEAAGVLGRPVATADDARAAADALRAAGARTALVSRGAAGFVAVTPDAGYAVHTLQPVSGNPTGAGDALAASAALGLARHVPWPELLADAAACAAAAVTAPVAGEIALDTARAIRPTVVVQVI